MKRYYKVFNMDTYTREKNVSESNVEQTIDRYKERGYDVCRDLEDDIIIETIETEN